MRHTSQIPNFHDFFKVENILKGSLDSIPSPSVKIQIMDGKGVRAKHRWVLSINILIQKNC